MQVQIQFLGDSEQVTTDAMTLEAFVEGLRVGCDKWPCLPDRIVATSDVLRAIVEKFAAPPEQPVTPLQRAMGVPIESVETLAEGIARACRIQDEGNTVLLVTA